MFEFLEIHIIQRQGSVPKIIEDEPEQLRVSVNEDGSSIILERLDSPT